MAPCGENPPLNDPPIDPQTGRFSRTWIQYFIRLSKCLQATSAAAGASGLNFAWLEDASGDDGSMIPGPPGPAGTSGAPGPQGPQGPALFMLSGDDGGDDAAVVPGPPGPQGPQGPQGPAGSGSGSVVPGGDGEPGEDGWTVPGPQGPTGAQGVQGIPGPVVWIEGEQGEEGPAIPGPQGLVGAIGPQGVQGVPGPPMWVEGEPGEEGPMVPGPMGLTGATGPQGVQGVPGPPMWLEGDPGEDGLPGVPGAAGVAGAAGPAGPPGLGAPGWDGEPGEDSWFIPGPQGAAGSVAGTGPCITVEVNLSATPTWRGKFTITDGSITSGTRVFVWQAPGPYTGKGTRADEAELQPVQVIAVESATGQCTVYWQTPPTVTSRPDPGAPHAQTEATNVVTNPKDPQAAGQQGAVRLGKVRGNVKFSYMVCRQGGTSVFRTTLTGTVSQLDFSHADEILWNNSAIATLESLVQGHADGQRLVIRHIGSAALFLKHQTTVPGTAKLSNFAKTVNADTPVLKGSAEYQYDKTAQEWRMIGHVQGEAVTPTFAAGEFTGSGSMTWTVDSGDVTVDKYILEGNRVTYFCYYQATTVGGTPSTDLLRAIPSVLTPKVAGDVMVLWSRNLDNGTANDGFAFIATSVYSGKMAFRRDKTSGNWAASTNNTSIQGQLSWEVA